MWNLFREDVKIVPRVIDEDRATVESLKLNNLVDVVILFSRYLKKEELLLENGFIVWFLYYYSRLDTFTVIYCKNRAKIESYPL